MAELLSPAGNFEKMKAAIRYGADAVYLAGTRFGMRAAADNFSIEELAVAIEYAHARGVRVYLTVNTMPHESEYPALEEYFILLKEVRPDALIIADIGVLMLARRIIPEIEIHISTQANAVSSAACNAWHALGAKRIVLARELSLEQIKEIRRNTAADLELEAFIHGSMCISYSGRCLLSQHLVGRDGNRGACAQPCRWDYSVMRGGYEIVEKGHLDKPMPIMEQNGETFIMASKDMCMIEHVRELVESGIDSFKIEGRMKSAYYTAVVTNTYRMAIDACNAGDYNVRSAWLDELDSVSHREYSTGYYFDDPAENAQTVTFMGYLREKAYIATVLAYDVNTSEAKLQLKNKVCRGDSVELLTPGKTGVRFVMEEMWNEERESIDAAPHPQQIFYAKLPFAVKEGDIIRSARD